MESVTPRRLRQLLGARGAAPRKRHGQHFLLDDGLLAAVVAAAGLEPGERVLEIGPGPGTLTRHLLAAGCSVVALEIDPVMREVAASILGPDHRERLTWIEADVLDGPRRLAPALQEVLPGSDALVSNLPYNVSGGVLGGLMTHAHMPRRLVVMLQKEVGERLLASPGGRSWGPLGVLTSLCTRAERVRRVPPGAFWPPPKVDSVVLRLERRADRPPPEGLSALQGLLGAAFHNRRKTLLNSLSEATGRPAAEVAGALGLPKKLQKVRAEAVQALEFYDLTQHWAASALGERHRP